MNICLFNTHATLTEKHARLCLSSLLQRQTQPPFWDHFFIFNSHQKDLPNQTIIDLLRELDTHESIQEVAIIPYNETTALKTLMYDFAQQVGTVLANHLDKPGKTLFLKSDYYLSRNFNESVLSFPETNHFWTAPIYNSKEWTTEKDFIDVSGFEKFTPVNEYICYDCGDNAPHTPATTVRSTRGELWDSPNVKFIAHNVRIDYNLHVASNDLLRMILETNLATRPLNYPYGGPHWEGLIENGVDYSSFTGAFGIHMYHSVSLREPKKQIPGQRW
jgi:hypothetical protein